MKNLKLPGAMKKKYFTALFLFFVYWPILGARV